MRPVEQFKVKTPLITNVTRCLWTETFACILGYRSRTSPFNSNMSNSVMSQLLRAATFSQLLRKHSWGKTHLFQSTTLGANKSHAVAIIDIGGHRGHAIPAFRIKCVSGHQLRAAKGLVDVQTAEGVINRDRLQEEKGQPRVSSLLGFKKSRSVWLFIQTSVGGWKGCTDFNTGKHKSHPPIQHHLFVLLSSEGKKWIRQH